VAIGTVTVTTAANWIPQIWASELSDATEAWIGLSDLVDRQFEDDLSVGDTVEIANRSNPAVRFKTADTSGTYTNVTETLENIVVNLQAYTGFLVEDIAELQSKYAVRSEYTEASTYSLMSVVEGDLTSGLGGLPDNFSQLTGTLGTDPTADDIIRAVQYLDDGDVPDDGRFFYMSPGTHAALLKQAVFTSEDYTTKGAIGTGRIKGTVYGATPHVSSLANNNPAAAGQSYSWFCHKRGVALVVQRGPTPHVQWENLEIGWGVVCDTIYNFIERKILPSALASTSPDDRFNVGVRGP
jgi:hypothetical protein